MSLSKPFVDMCEVFGIPTINRLEGNRFESGRTVVTRLGSGWGVKIEYREYDEKFTTWKIERTGVMYLVSPFFKPIMLSNIWLVYLSMTYPTVFVEKMVGLLETEGDIWNTPKYSRTRHGL